MITRTRSKETRTLPPRLEKLHDELVSTCKPLKQIAYELGIVHGTARVYQAEIWRQLDAPGGRVELMHREIERLKKLRAPREAKATS